MYIPEHFLITDPAEIDNFIAGNGFGQLISLVDGGLFATHLPLLYDSTQRLLQGHIARANPQWQALDGQQVLVILPGPHDYVSPSWYSDPGVPTWNYQAVHITGTARTTMDAPRLEHIITTLTNRYEARFEQPWSPTWHASKLKGIVGIEIAINAIQCKYKLSQNRSANERREVARQILASGNSALTQAMLDLD